MAIFVIFAPKGGKPCDGNKEPIMKVLYHINNSFIAIN
jgi:hypothetical protein